MLNCWRVVGVVATLGLGVFCAGCASEDEVVVAEAPATRGRPAEAWAADLAKHDRAVRDAAVAALTDIGEPGVPLVVPHLDSKDPGTRYSALAVLAAVGPGALPQAEVVTARLADTDAQVRAEAAYTLGRLGKDAPMAVAPLTKALSDTDWYVRWRAATALGGLGHWAETAIEKLESVVLHDLDRRVGVVSEEALGLIRADIGRWRGPR